MSLAEAYKGGVVPVALVYDEPEDLEVKRPLRDTLDKKTKKENSEEEEEDSVSEEQSDDEYSNNKNSKLLSLEARETEDDIAFGIQSRNKVPLEDDQEQVLKPFVYNIQPLSFYSAETKDEQSVLNFINKIKEIRENQVKQDLKKQQEKDSTKPIINKHEEAVVTESEADEEGPIRRKIQHYETVIKPMMVDPQMYGAVPQGAYPVYPASTMGLPQPFQPFPTDPQSYQPYHTHPQPYQPYLTNPQSYQPYHANPQPYQQPFNPYYQTPQAPMVVYLPNPFKSDSTRLNTKSENTRIFDDYFPFVVNNPFNEIWAGITNIVEYGPSADVCRRDKKGRGDSDDDSTTETVIDLPSRRISFGGSKNEDWPKIARLKVRRGGVAIAGPGGIATAGSGGTAIVGPGGTAYTTREGTAVVGPGGKVVHVPQFPVYAKSVDGSEPREFVPPAGSRTVAEGPIVYYDNPLDQDDLPDPSIPI